MTKPRGKSIPRPPKKRGMAVAELVEIEHWTLRLPMDEPFTPNNRFREFAYRVGWDHGVAQDCWHTPHELDRRFPNPTVVVNRLDVTYALPEVVATGRTGQGDRPCNPNRAVSPLAAVQGWRQVRLLQADSLQRRFPAFPLSVPVIPEGYRGHP